MHLHALYNLYTAQRALGNVEARHPIFLINDGTLRVQIKHTLVYVTYDGVEYRFNEPVRLVRMHAAGTDGLYVAFKQLCNFIKTATR
jgi:hypothetical protein